MIIWTKDVGRTAQILIHIFTFNFVVALAKFDIAPVRRFPYQNLFALRFDGDMNFQSNGMDRLEFFSECVDECGISSLVSEVKNEDGSIAQLVRVEKESNSASSNGAYTKADIARMIQVAREEQGQYSLSDLYPRDWEDREEAFVGDGVVSNYSRVASFSVMQFNTLAEGLSSCQAKRPFKINQEVAAYQRDPNEYGGFTSIPNPSIILDFGRRRWRLLEVIFGPKLDAPYDIIALEEVDRYRGFFGPILKLLGYASTFVPKKNSPGVRLGWYSDGCVLAWKSSVFDVIDEVFGDYSVGNQVYVIATLKHKPSDQVIIVSATHLKAQQSDVNELVRCRQVEELLAQIDQVVNRLVSNDSVSHENVSVIVLGDFNGDPPAHSQSKSENSAVGLITTHKGLELNTNCSLFYRSAYNIDDPSIDFFTSWKIRGSKKVKRIIDYIFYAGSSIRCSATLKVVPLHEIEEAKLPGFRHPSDHLHVCAKFEIRCSS